MEEKIRIIKLIQKRHPSCGVDIGWSEYVGGMKDTGQWFTMKMLDESIENLQAFLDSLILDESRPIIPLTEEELADSKIIHKMPNGGFMTELFRKRLEKFSVDCERKYLFGE